MKEFDSVYFSIMAVVNETYVQPQPVRSTVTMPCEHSMVLNTGAFRGALAFNLMPDVVALRRNFSEVVVSNVRAEVRQDALIGPESGDLAANGRIFVAVIPSGKNTDASSGTNPATVMAVRRKQAFPLSSATQENKVMAFDLLGFEVDVAQDPRRQQGLVAWIGNTGIVASTKGQTLAICSVTWYFDCTCTGIAASW